MHTASALGVSVIEDSCKSSIGWHRETDFPPNGFKDPEMLPVFNLFNDRHSSTSLGSHLPKGSVGVYCS